MNKCPMSFNYREMNEEKKMTGYTRYTKNIDTQQGQWFCRLGGIITNLYPTISILADSEKYEIYLQESEYHVSVKIEDNGYLYWDDFADSDIENAELRWDKGRAHFDPIVEEIEKRYYSEEYNAGSEAEVFFENLKVGKYSVGTERIKSCVLNILWIVAAIAFSIWMSK